MGIKGLYKVIKSEAPHHLVEYHLSELSGKSLAIDISIFLYKYIRSATDGGWRNLFILFLCKLKKYRIKGVCIFDGPDFPDEKMEEQKKRREQTAKSVERLDKCILTRNMLQDVVLVGDTELTSTMKETCKKLIHPKSGMTDLTDYDRTGSIVDSINEVIIRLERQTAPIKRSETAEAAIIAELLGLPTIMAKGEAEALCSYLACLGYVDAVMTEDTDVLAYGTPMMIAFKNFKLGDEKVYGIHLPSLREEMGLNELEFRDMCIMLQCDYNKRVKGYPPREPTAAELRGGKPRPRKPVCLGEKAVVSMIKTYGTIENFLHLIEDPAPLKYERCRELFSVPSTLPSKFVPAVLRDPDYKRLEKYIKTNKVHITIDYIRKAHPKPELVYDSDTSDDESDGRSSDSSDDSSDDESVSLSSDDSDVELELSSDDE